MSDNMSDSEIGSIECFQNYTASEVFIQGLAGIVDQEDVESMIRSQKQMLQRFEKTNEMLTNCNNLCVTRLKTASTEFKKHSALLTEMRKDLDNIFKRIQVLKSRTSTQYPDAFAVMSQPEKADEVPQNTEETENSQSQLKAPLDVVKVDNSWSSESGNNSQQDSSPCSTDTG